MTKLLIIFLFGIIHCGLTACKPTMQFAVSNQNKNAYTKMYEFKILLKDQQSVDRIMNICSRYFMPEILSISQRNTVFEPVEVRFHIQVINLAQLDQLRNELVQDPGMINILII